LTKDGSKIERMLYAGKQSGQGARGLRGGDQASAADPADHSSADAGPTPHNLTE